MLLRGTYFGLWRQPRSFFLFQSEAFCLTWEFRKFHSYGIEISPIHGALSDYRFLAYVIVHYKTNLQYYFSESFI